MRINKEQESLLNYEQKSSDTVKEVISKSHPTHYLMHKYWGRKAHNLIYEYIMKFTKEGDLVLDPFMGSGGVIIESKKTNRRSIGVDLNPISIFIVENTLSTVDLERFQKEYDHIISNLPKEIIDLTLTKCPVCNKLVQIDNAVWKDDKLVRIKAKCKEHSTFQKDADSYDFSQLNKSETLLRKYEKDKDFFYPTEKMLDYVKRNGRTNINQLFTERNLLISSLILLEINQVKDEKIHRLMQMVFTSMLPNVSKMIPANIKSVTGKSGWQISKFWVPKINTEKNVLDSFSNRFNKIYNGKKEVLPLLSNAEHKIYNKNSENLDFIGDNTIDYIFTDPPYGESIAYFGLSMFWNSWLKLNVDYESEIIYDPNRGKKYADYGLRLSNVYKEMYRILKPGKYLSFTFHNRNLRFWKIIIDACLTSGFELKDITWQPQAVSSGTQGINRKNTLKGDFVYNFIKPKTNKCLPKLDEINGEDIVLDKMEDIFKQTKFIEPHKLYEILIPLIVTKRAFLDSNSNILDIDKLLFKNYKYAEIKKNGVCKYGWKKE